VAAPGEDAELRADIRRFRAESGLQTDDATIDWFVTEYLAERHDGGMWLTDAEWEATAAREELIEAGGEVVRRYADAERATFAGEWLTWSDGIPSHVVAFTGDIDRHGEALRRLHPYPEVLELVEHARALHDLEHLQKRAEKVAEALHDEGVWWKAIGLDVEQNRIELEIVAPDEAAAREKLLDELGDGVVVVYLGPEDTKVEPVPWQEWSTDDPATKLTVHYTTNATFAFERVEHTEDDEVVRATVLERQPVGAVALPAAIRSATITLERPLRERVVVDGSTGEQRSRRRDR
jgi:hypothetical protein